MIPEKIYIDAVMAIDSDDGTYYVDNYPNEFGIEYTLSPTIKKFADEKPKASGRYWVKYNNDVHWYTAEYFGELWFDEDGYQLSPPDLWCEIIFPEDK